MEQEQPSEMTREIYEIYDTFRRLRELGWKRVIIKNHEHLFRLVSPDWNDLYKKREREVPFSPLSAMLWVNNGRSIAGTDNSTLNTEEVTRAMGTLHFTKHAVQVLDTTGESFTPQDQTSELLRQDLEKIFPREDSVLMEPPNLQM